MKRERQLPFKLQGSIFLKKEVEDLPIVILGPCKQHKHILPQVNLSKNCSKPLVFQMEMIQRVWNMITRGLQGYPQQLASHNHANRDIGGGLVSAFVHSICLPLRPHQEISIVDSLYLLSICVYRQTGIYNLSYKLFTWIYQGILGSGHLRSKLQTL